MPNIDEALDEEAAKREFWSAFKRARRVVRGPAALLAVVGAAFAYFLVAPELPQLHPPELSALVSCTVGLTLVVGIAAGLAAVADSPLALVPAAGRLGAARRCVDGIEAGAAATPLEAILFCCLGIAFAVVFDAPALAVALPLFLAVVDIAESRAGGSAGLFTLSVSKPGDAFTLELPDGGWLAAARLGAPEVVFVGAFAAYARRLGLRARAAEAGMLAGLLAAAASEVLLHSELPTIALMALGYLAPNVDRIQALFARPAGSHVGAMDLEEKSLSRWATAARSAGPS